MPRLDPRIDAYIAKAAPFAQPILKHIRKLVHAACPDIEETLKWSMPHFVRQGIVCGMAGFKEHCALNFWKSRLIFTANEAASETAKSAMGDFGRLTAVSDLPTDKVLIGYIRKAARLNTEGVKLPPRKRSKEKTKLVVPPELMAALKQNGKNALENFERLGYSHKKEYIEWITEAKRAETKTKRIAAALAMIAEGKSRYWKYA